MYGRQIASKVEQKDLFLPCTFLANACLAGFLTVSLLCYCKKCKMARLLQMACPKLIAS